MPAKRLTAPEPKTVKERLQRLVSKEYNNEANYSANVSLLKAVGLFVGGIFVARNFGEFFLL